MFKSLSETVMLQLYFALMSHDISSTYTASKISNIKKQKYHLCGPFGRLTMSNKHRR